MRDKGDRTRHTLMRYVAQVLGSIAVMVLVDSGASDNFMDMSVARKANLKLEKLPKSTSAKLANGSHITIEYVVRDVLMQIGAYTLVADFKVMPMTGLGIVLGKPWLNDADPHVSWKTNTMHIRTPEGDVTIALNGSTSSIDFHELNLVGMDTIMDLGKHANRLMCVSLHSVYLGGAQRQEVAPSNVQEELIWHNGSMYNIWVHDAMDKADHNLTSLTKQPPPTMLDAKAQALVDWEKHHQPTVDDKQNFDKESYAAIKDIVVENIDIHIPHESTPPGQVVTIGHKTAPYEHIIETIPDAKPPSQQPYRLSPTEMTG